MDPCYQRGSINFVLGNEVSILERAIHYRIKGDQSQNSRCYIVESHEEEQRSVRKMTKSQIEKFNKVKDAEEEILEDGNDK